MSVPVATSASDPVDPLRTAVRDAVTNARGSSSSSVPAATMDALGDAIITYLDDLVNGAQHLREIGGSRVLTDVNVREAKVRLASPSRRQTADAAAVFGGIALGAGVSGLIAVLLTEKQPTLGTLLLLYMLSVLGTASTVWGIRK